MNIRETNIFLIFARNFALKIVQQSYYKKEKCGKI